jgi:hypothetical protein
MNGIPVNHNLNIDQTLLIQKKLILLSEIKNGLNWFYWIGGLSIINSIIYQVGGSFTFIVGLGITQFVDVIMKTISNDLGLTEGMIIRIIGIVINLIIAGLFIIAGVIGRKKYRIVIIIGMVAYVLDGLLLLAVGEWLGIAFHLLALWGLWRGLQAIGKLKVLEAGGVIAIPEVLLVKTTVNQRPPRWLRILAIIIIASIICCTVLFIAYVLLSKIIAS